YPLRRSRRLSLETCKGPSSGDVSTGVPHKVVSRRRRPPPSGAAGRSRGRRAASVPAATLGDVVTEGDPAPDFTATTDAGERISLPDFRGKPVVLYFYPKDDTPGCTTQAQGIRDAYAEFERAGAVVLGISPDSESKHVKFKEKYDLPFTLLAD